MLQGFLRPVLPLLSTSWSGGTVTRWRPRLSIYCCLSMSIGVREAHTWYALKYANCRTGQNAAIEAYSSEASSVVFLPLVLLFKDLLRRVCSLESQNSNILKSRDSEQGLSKLVMGVHVLAEHNGDRHR